LGLDVAQTPPRVFVEFSEADEKFSVRFVVKFGFCRVVELTSLHYVEFVEFVGGWGEACEGEPAVGLEINGERFLGYLLEVWIVLEVDYDPGPCFAVIEHVF
jgi:hypothetical protein